MTIPTRGLLGLLAGLTFFAAAPAIAQAPERTMPTFALKTPEGKLIDTKAFRGRRAALMVVWASW